MYVIEGKTPGIVWRNAAVEVYREGSEVKDGQELLRELMDVMLICSNPLKSDMMGGLKTSEIKSASFFWICK